MPACRVKRDSRSIRDIQRTDDAGHIQTGEGGDCGARLLPQSLAFSTQNQRDLAAAECIFKLCWAFRIKTNGLETCRVQFFQCVGKIAHFNMVDVFQCA